MIVPKADAATLMDVVDALDWLQSGRAHLIAMAATLAGVDSGCDDEVGQVFRRLAAVERRLTGMAVTTDR